ncbi:MAG: DUF1461 domain-containing protein [Clostridiales bacterium]|nr:DUF1461 domain-containing protein [Clostridiales bacterium]
MALIFLLVFCFIAFAAGLIADQALDESRMLDKMIEYADTSLTQVDMAEYPKLVSSITGYLSGRFDTAQVDVIKGDRMVPAFTDNELLHLRDIKDLLGLSHTLKHMALTLIISSFILSFPLKKKEPILFGEIKPLVIFNWAAGIILAILMGVFLWGFIDFENLFIAFHQLLFRNDLWLLDPQTDLLLQLMPLGFFISYGVDIIKQNGVLIILLPVALAALNIIKRRQHEIS